MSSFTNIFHSHFKEHPQTPDEFPEYKLEFLPSHEPSFKQLGDVLFTKDEDRSEEGSFKDVANMNEEEVEDLFELQVEIKLRRFTSFQNGFMENHRKVLKNSLQEFLQKTSKFHRITQDNHNQIDIANDIKSILFNEKLFTHEQIHQNRQRLLKKVDEFKILKEMFQNLQEFQKNITKDAILLGFWILKHTDHLVQGILHENSFCIKEVEMLKNQLLEYLNGSSNISVLNQKIAQASQSSKEFNQMIESWLYILLIAKLGYFENDCFDVEISLEDHLKALLKEQKRNHTVYSEQDSEDDEILSLELLTKKIKQ